MALRGAEIWDVAMRLELDDFSTRELKVGTPRDGLPHESEPECLASIPHREEGRSVREHKSNGGLLQLVDC